MANRSPTEGTEPAPPLHAHGSDCGCSDPGRRDFLLRCAAAAIVSTLPAPIAVAAGRGANIHRLQGRVWVNGTVAGRDTAIRPGDEVVTGHDGTVIFALDNDVFLLRANSRMRVEARDGVYHSLKLAFGRLLGVFESNARPRTVATPVMTAGIRGTGCYVETDNAISYFCDCYGTIDVAGRSGGRETLRANHHNARWIRHSTPMQTMLAPAPMRGHGDAELILLESVVGRKPPREFFMPM
ncbi:MAG: hypothetical protein ACPGU7_05170 [Gammaproteobacteria bacterium]